MSSDTAQHLHTIAQAIEDGVANVGETIDAIKGQVLNLIQWAQRPTPAPDGVGADVQAAIGELETAVSGWRDISSRLHSIGDSISTALPAGATGGTGGSSATTPADSTSGGASTSSGSPTDTGGGIVVGGERPGSGTGASTGGQAGTDPTAAAQPEEGDEEESHF